MSPFTKCSPLRGTFLVQRRIDAENLKIKIGLCDMSLLRSASWLVSCFRTYLQPLVLFLTFLTQNVDSLTLPCWKINLQFYYPHWIKDWIKDQSHIRTPKATSFLESFNKNVRLVANYSGMELAFSFRTTMSTIKLLSTMDICISYPNLAIFRT